MKHKHRWAYLGGQAKCRCGKYVQPDGRITSTPSGRRRTNPKRKGGRVQRTTTKTVDVRTVTRRVNPRRRPRVHTAAFDRCVREVRGARNPYAVCSGSMGERGILKKHRRRAVNPRLFVIVARRGRARLKYTGNKFSRSGRAVLYASQSQARSVAYWLKAAFAPQLKGWRVGVE